MQWLQITAGRGPVECQRAVKLLSDALMKEWQSSGVPVDLVDAVKSKEKDCFYSILLSVDTDLSSVDFEGSVKWICESPFRKNHKRKNWFVGVQVLTQPKTLAFDESLLRFETCRASGPGGQHVNTTSSAVRVICDELGLSAQASEERSQHRNKALALARLSDLVKQKNESGFAESKAEHWMNHNSLERGDPIRIYKGLGFKRVK